MPEERRSEMRRADDHATIGELKTRMQHLEDLREQDVALHKQSIGALQDKLMGELKTIRTQNETQLEIMTAWNSAKGFVKSVQTIGSVMTWLVKIAAAGAALWAMLHYGGGDK